MPTFNGHALIYGISEDGTTVQVGFYAKAWIDSTPLAFRAKMDEHIGCDGLTGAFVWTNPYIELNVTLRSSETTNIAAAKATAVFIAKGAKVTLDNFLPIKLGSSDGTGVGTTDYLNGDWLNVSDSTLTLNKDEAATVDLGLRRYIDSAQMTTLLTQLT